jgi:lipopolysaccharide/colanic/teichoic acid biosynthesis glycosyltransferase
VLKGDMSLVGPRPHAMAHNSQYAEIVDQYLGRHRVKPGITGWAQVNGLRGETDTLNKMRRRVEYDLYYIDNWSLWFDLRILLLTPFVGFVNKNAY